MLYASLFKKPDAYIRVIELLAKKKMGMTRQELLSGGGFEDNGIFSDILKDLEWCGLAFERTCLWHVDQIKKKLGISGILTNEYAWRCLPDENVGRLGVQIDLLIDRSDGIIDVCEMKYSKDSFTITSDYANKLALKRNVFQAVTGTKKAIHSIMVTTDGLTRNEYRADVQAEVQLDDLYEL
ncbi:MAG: hypothetical protein PUD79_04495 [Prevotellaceae bacterium]|nr:hypothetical protein [Prevotellaceae bacterium]